MLLWPGGDNHGGCRAARGSSGQAEDLAAAGAVACGRDVGDVARPSPNPAAELSDSTTGCSACRHRDGTHDSRQM